MATPGSSCRPAPARRSRHPTASAPSRPRPDEIEMARTAGLGFKLEHLDAALACRAEGLWFEVHAENYMVEGGPRLAALEALRARHPISLHAVGLSIASTEPPDPEHLRRLAALVRRIEPAAISDHLAWQRWQGVHYADFLPFPR